VKKNSIFGEISFFTGKPRSATVKCKGFAEVFAIEKDDFDELCKRNPEALAIFKELEQKVTGGNFEEIGLRCYVCQQATHIALNCPSFSLIKGNLRPKNEKVLKELTMTERIRLLDARFINEVIENDTIYTESEAEIQFDPNYTRRKLKQKSKINHNLDSNRKGPRGKQTMKGKK